MDQMLSKCVVGVPIKSTGRLLTSKPHNEPHYPVTATSSNGRLGPKLFEIMKHKLTNGTKIVQFGSQSKIFRKNFSSNEGEKLLQASQCNLYTTAGAIAGLLFVSTERVAFLSIKSIEMYSSTGKLLKFQYKVSIPLGKIKGLQESISMKRSSNNYLELVTVDDFSFWFTGFKSYKKMLGYLHRSIGDYVNS
ncbi:GEM-like protein 6 isoform X2 [Rutidosis leptorrhynchoides]|uniref:GEM-like protein 6 isoform X2 n=1 Tax=Rutidosis leptorrhynchoides TaxID=125765 RepID=UPI003A999B0D